MLRIFSDPAWTYPLYIRQRMADDLRDYGRITSTTLAMKQDFALEMGYEDFEQWVKGE